MPARGESKLARSCSASVGRRPSSAGRESFQDRSRTGGERSGCSRPQTKPSVAEWQMNCGGGSWREGSRRTAGEARSVTAGRTECSAGGASPAGTVMQRLRIRGGRQERPIPHVPTTLYTQTSPLGPSLLRLWHCLRGAFPPPGCCGVVAVLLPLQVWGCGFAPRRATCSGEHTIYESSRNASTASAACWASALDAGMTPRPQPGAPHGQPQHCLSKHNSWPRYKTSEHFRDSNSGRGRSAWSMACLETWSKAPTASTESTVARSPRSARCKARARMTWRVSRQHAQQLLGELGFPHTRGVKRHQARASESWSAWSA